METDAKVSQDLEADFTIVQRIKKKNRENEETHKRINQSREHTKMQTKARATLTLITTLPANSTVVPNIIGR